MLLLNRQSKSPDLAGFSLATNFEGVLLIGKDGGIKLKKPFIVKPQTIFDLVDSMPMRRAEMRSKYQNDIQKLIQSTSLKVKSRKVKFFVSSCQTERSRSLSEKPLKNCYLSDVIIQVFELELELVLMLVLELFWAKVKG